MTRIKTKNHAVYKNSISHNGYNRMLNSALENNRSRKKLRQRYNSIVQFNGQCCIQENNGTMKKLRNKVDVNVVRITKDYLKWTPKPGYMSQKI